MVAQTSYPSIWEAEVNESCVQGQHRIQSEQLFLKEKEKLSFEGYFFLILSRQYWG